MIVSHGHNDHFGGAKYLQSTYGARIVVTPGHTPGTISPIFEVRDGERRHYVGYWGGDGAGHLDPQGLRTYAAAVDRFISLDPRVDVPLSNHVVADGTVLKLPMLAARKPGDPHPFVRGNPAFRAWAGVLKSCAEAFLPRN